MHPRLVFYSHDGFGLGHFRRNLALAAAVVGRCPDATVLLACGAEGVESFPLPDRVDVVRLPGLRKVGNGHYVGRRLPIEEEEILSLRSALLSSAIDSFRPQVLLADKHPIGVHGELLPALARLRQHGGRAALGLRDVLDDRERTVAEWADSELAQHVARWHELLLVYGSRTVLTPIEARMLPPLLESRLRYCGYVVGEVSSATAGDMPPHDGRPVVLATVGGGEDGLPILEAVLGAAAMSDWQVIVVAGPQMAQAEWEHLERRAGEVGALALRSVRDVQRWYAHVDAIVCMGGYNTLLEAVASGTPTVCVPRVHPRREQVIRARAFAERGLIGVVEPTTLTAAAIARQIEHALDARRDDTSAASRQAIDRGGAGRAAALLLDLAAGASAGRSRASTAVGAA